MNLKVILAGGLAVTAVSIAAAMVMPQAAQPDFASLPPAPATIEAKLKSTSTRLAQAIAAAEQRVGGIAGAATARLNNEPAVFEVMAYANGTAQLVTIDAGTGSVIDVREVPRFPGVAVEGDWIETSSGLKYYDIVVGTGDMPPTREATVKIRFSGYLVNGDQFGSSGEDSMALSLSAVPAGLAEGIGTMRAGGERKLIIPPALAAGLQGMPPDATLIFDVELIDVADYSAVPGTLPGAPVESQLVTLPSGLMYHDIAQGRGETPAGPGTVVRVHYTGWLNDGTKFDSSYDHPGGNPYQTPLNQVIKGWTEGVGSMKVGGKRKLVIPFDMAYGAAGDPRRHAAARTLLIFDVELVEIVNQ